MKKLLFIFIVMCGQMNGSYFIAIDLPQEVQGAVHNIQKFIQKRVPSSLPMSSPNKLHITVQFLAQTLSPQQIQQVDQILKAVSGKFHSQDLTQAIKDATFAISPMNYLVFNLAQPGQNFIIQLRAELRKEFAKFNIPFPTADIPPHISLTSKGIDQNLKQNIPFPINPTKKFNKFIVNKIIFKGPIPEKIYTLL